MGKYIENQLEIAKISLLSALVLFISFGFTFLIGEPSNIEGVMNKNLKESFDFIESIRFYILLIAITLSAMAFFIFSKASKTG